MGTASWDFAKSVAGLHLVDVRDLVDKRGNVEAMIKAKITEALQALEQGRQVVICCDYGISRSNSIAAGVLALYEKIPMDAAVQRVLAATGEEGIKLEVLDAVRGAVEGTGSAASSGGVLITGGSGFIGSSLVQRLREEGETVLAPSRQEIDLTKDVILLDLLVKKHGIQKIIHLATPRIYTTNEALGNALVMLKNVLDVAAQNQAKLYYLSGWEIYSGYRAQSLLADERLPARPGSTYGQAKYLSEVLIRQFVEQRGLESLIIRSGPVYGTRSQRPKFIWNFLAKARKNEDIVTHRYWNGLPALDLLYIDDLLAALWKAVRLDICGELNIGTGVGVTTAEVARLLVEKTGSRSRISQVAIDDYVGNIVMDYRRARALLGWEPQVTISQGLEQYLQSSEETIE
ncbi:MAG: NAD-dependent epimerase/dehydratase family protein [Anaerolineales bacterium]